MNGKGSKPRPLGVSRDDYAERWDRVFRKKAKKDLDTPADRDVPLDPGEKQ